MARASGIAHRAETLLGTPVVATTPVAGGDICTATRLKLSNGGTALVGALIITIVSWGLDVLLPDDR